MHLSSYFRLQFHCAFIRRKVRKPCGMVGFGISMEPSAWHPKTCSEGSPRAAGSSTELAVNSAGEAEATGEGRKEVGTWHVSWTGGAEHHRSAWETSEDATRPGLRRFCDLRVQSAVCVHSNKPRFHVCQVPAVLGHHSLVVTLPLPEMSGLCSQSPSGVSPLPAET